MTDAVTEINGLIDAYWGLAFNEGRDGRTTDTPDGDAQRVRSAISERLDVLVSEIQQLREREGGQEPVAWPGRQFCEIAERNVAELATWIDGYDDKQIAVDAALAIRTLLASPTSPTEVKALREALEKIEDYITGAIGAGTVDIRPPANFTRSEARDSLMVAIRDIAHSALKSPADQEKSNA